MPRLFTPTIIGLLLFASSSLAQNQTEPYTLSSNQTRVWVWTSGSITYAEVRATFGDPNYTLDWGQVTNRNNTLSVDIPVTHILGVTLGVVTEFSHIYQLGTLVSGAYTFAVTSRGSGVQSLQFDRDQSVEHWEAVSPHTEPNQFRSHKRLWCIVCKYQLVFRKRYLSSHRLGISHANRERF